MTRTIALAIGVVDDRDHAREYIERRLNRAIKPTYGEGQWRIVAVPPFAALDRYPGWISEEEIVVLLLDERLNESAEKHVAYSGHDIVRYVRPRLYDLPIYYVTAVPDEPAVTQDAPRVQGILSRDEFNDNDNVGRWLAEFVREGQRYWDKTARKLARLGQLAEEVARGKASDEMRAEIASIRQELQLMFEHENDAPEVVAASRAELLTELDQAVSEMESIRADLESIAKRPRQASSNKKR